MTDTEATRRAITKSTRVSMTLGAAFAACVCLLGAGGVAIKAKSDLEYANLSQDAEIATLREKIAELKETITEIRNDVKTLVRRTP